MTDFIIEGFFYFIWSLIEYLLWGKRNQEEYAAYTEQAKKEAREELLADFQQYKEQHRLLRDHVDVIKIRNLQRKYQFELHLKTAEGTYPFEKMSASLSKYDAENRKLRWDMKNKMPGRRDEEPQTLIEYQEALQVLLADRDRLEDLKSQIRPFVEQPI